MALAFYQLFEPETCTYTYLVGDPHTRECALVDSMKEEFSTYISLLKELGYALKYLIETHVHADHITALSLLQQKFPKAEAVVSRHSQVF